MGIAIIWLQAAGDKLLAVGYGFLGNFTNQTGVTCKPYEQFLAFTGHCRFDTNPASHDSQIPVTE